MENQANQEHTRKKYQEFNIKGIALEYSIKLETAEWLKLLRAITTVSCELNAKETDFQDQVAELLDFAGSIQDSVINK